jgi:hypothetical protein
MALVTSGIIHLAAVSEHVAESALHGPFFLVLAVVADRLGRAGNGRWPAAVRRGYALLNAAVIGLWFVSRSTGLPAGSEPWQAEAVGIADLLCTALEAVVVVLLVLMKRRPEGQQSAALTKAQRRMVAVGARWGSLPSPLLLLPPARRTSDNAPDQHGHQVSAATGRPAYIHSVTGACSSPVRCLPSLHAAI